MAPHVATTVTDTVPKFGIHIKYVTSNLAAEYHRDILLVAEILIAKHGPKSIFFHIFVNFDGS